MVTLLGRNWWVLLLRGLLSIIFGVLVLVWPVIAVEVLVLLFGAFVLLDGVFAIVSAIRGRKDHRLWWLVLLEGIAGITFGVVTLIWPQITALVLLLLIAGWAIATGALQIAAAILLRKELAGEWLLVVGGILSVAFGVLLVIQPQAGAIALVWLIGVYSIFFGMLLIVLAFRLRRWLGQIQEVARQI